MNTKNLPNLPASEDEYWKEAELHKFSPKKVNICATHFKKWHKHDGYLDNHDGTISCKYCPWGTRLPGYMRVLEGKIVDLRKL